MSQEDFNIETADANTGVTYRAAVNAALQALASLSSGATAPVTSYAYQVWANTTDGYLYIRDSTNTSWIKTSILLDGTLSPIFATDLLANSVTIGRGTGNKASNMVVGNDALMHTSTGENNVAIGYQTLHSNSIGLSNVAIGYQALLSNDGDNNIAIGNSTLRANTTGHSNTGIGFESLYTNIDGIYNTGVGTNTLRLNSSGQYNTAIGVDALTSNDGGNFNTAIGVSALLTNTSGGGNVAISVDALRYNSTGNYNVAIGGNASLNNMLGSYNLAIGFRALEGNTNGSYNTSIGYNSLRIATGNYNVAIGVAAGSKLTTGINNVFIGLNAGGVSPQLVTASQSVAIGYGAYSTKSNQVVIGNSTDTVESVLYGDVKVQGFSSNLVTVTDTTNYTVTFKTASIIINNSFGSTTLTLPDAATYPGKVINLRTIKNQTVISASSNVVPLAGGSAGTAILSNTAGKWAMLQSDGTSWHIMAAN